MSERVEVWKVCEDYPRYEVSNLGRVRNKKTQRILKPAGGENYQQYNLFTVDGPRCDYGHRLVAKAFVPNPNNYKTVHHKDHKRWNNEDTNLEWVEHATHVSSHRKGQHWKWSEEAKARRWTEEARAERSRNRKEYIKTEAGKAHMDKWMSAMRAGKAKKQSITQ